MCDLKHTHGQKDTVYALIMKKQKITILLFPNLVSGLYTFSRRRKINKYIQIENSSRE
jgi:hypothetical protein